MKREMTALEEREVTLEFLRDRIRNCKHDTKVVARNVQAEVVYRHCSFCGKITDSYERKHS